MARIFLLAGAPAVGKSTTAHALAGRFEKSLHIPVDDIRSMVVSGVLHPGSTWSNELSEQLRLARESVAETAIRYYKAGFVVVIDDFWDPNSRLVEYHLLFEQPGMHKVLLFPSQQQAQERNKKRSGEGDEYIAEGIRAVYEGLNADIPNLTREGWIIADSTDRTVNATVEYILDQIE